MTKPPWSHIIRMGAVGNSPVQLDLEAGEAERGRVARLLDLAELNSLKARITVTPWYDGVEIAGDWSAELVQTCGVTLEPLPSSPSGRFVVHAVREDSPHAPSPADEIALDPDAPDPPDVLETDDIDLAGYVVEHLALEIDPFPRKPGAEFEPPKDDAELSPFAALRALQTPPGKA